MQINKNKKKKNAKNFKPFEGATHTHEDQDKEKSGYPVYSLVHMFINFFVNMIDLTKSCFIKISRKCQSYFFPIFSPIE